MGDWISNRSTSYECSIYVERDPRMPQEEQLSQRYLMNASGIYFETPWLTRGTGETVSVRTYGVLPSQRSAMRARVPLWVQKVNHLNSQIDIVSPVEAKRSVWTENLTKRPGGFTYLHTPALRRLSAPPPFAPNVTYVKHCRNALPMTVIESQLERREGMI